MGTYPGPVVVTTGGFTAVRERKDRRMGSRGKKHPSRRARRPRHRGSSASGSGGGGLKRKREEISSNQNPKKEIPNPKNKERTEKGRNLHGFLTTVVVRLREGESAGSPVSVAARPALPPVSPHHRAGLCLSSGPWAPSQGPSTVARSALCERAHRRGAPRWCRFRPVLRRPWRDAEKRKGRGVGEDAVASLTGTDGGGAADGHRGCHCCCLRC
jgi:hypothetical protein